MKRGSRITRTKPARSSHHSRQQPPTASHRALQMRNGRATFEVETRIEEIYGKVRACLLSLVMCFQLNVPPPSKLQPVELAPQHHAQMMRSVDDQIDRSGEQMCCALCCGYCAIDNKNCLYGCDYEGTNARCCVSFRCCCCVFSKPSPCGCVEPDKIHKKECCYCCTCGLYCCSCACISPKAGTQRSRCCCCIYAESYPFSAGYVENCVFAFLCMAVV